MSDRSIEDELRELAEEIATGPDAVAEFAAVHAQTYREQRLLILGMLNVDAMVGGDDREIDEQHPLLVALRVELRDRLRRLIAWARQTEHM